MWCSAGVIPGSGERSLAFSNLTGGISVPGTGNYGPLPDWLGTVEKELKLLKNEDFIDSFPYGSVHLRRSWEQRKTRN